MCRLILTAGLCLIIATLASGQLSQQFCNGKRDGDYTNVNNPYTFYTCSNGLTYLRNCPSGLIFRQSCDCCDWPTTTASTTTTKTSTKTTPAATTDKFCNGKRDGDYTNINNPYTFYTCSNGLTYLRNCPSGLIFRQSCDCCDWPTTTTKSGGSADKFCNGKRDGDYTNVKNPYTFYTCSNGLTYLRKCPSGLIFRQSCDCCDWPTTTTKSGGCADKFCNGKRDGDYTNVNNPYTFYTCSNGLTYLRNCPSGLIFRQSCDCCDWPSTTASTTTTKTSTKTTSAATTDKFCNGKSDGDYTNVNNPYTFYTCSNGLTYLRNCPSGLIFRQSCDCCQ